MDIELNCLKTIAAPRVNKAGREMIQLLGENGKSVLGGQAYREVYKILLQDVHCMQVELPMCCLEKIFAQNF